MELPLNGAIIQSLGELNHFDATGSEFRRKLFRFAMVDPPIGERGKKCGQAASKSFRNAAAGHLGLLDALDSSEASGSKDGFSEVGRQSLHKRYH